MIIKYINENDSAVDKVEFGDIFFCYKLLGDFTRSCKNDKKSLYIIFCKDGKFYVGVTDNDLLRWEGHLGGNCPFTKKYTPLLMLSEELRGDNQSVGKHAENNLTYDLMHKFGIDNVRGGAYSKPDLNESDKKNIQREIESINDLCYKCGQKGHYASNCICGFTMGQLQPMNKNKSKNKRKKIKITKSSKYYEHDPNGNVTDYYDKYGDNIYKKEFLQIIPMEEKMKINAILLKGQRDRKFTDEDIQKIYKEWENHHNNKRSLSSDTENNTPPKKRVKTF